MKGVQQPKPPKAYGRTPLIAAGALALGVMGLAGVAAVAGVTHDDGIVAAMQQKESLFEQAGHDRAPAPGDAEGKVTVTLPDVDNNGVPDELEPERHQGNEVAPEPVKPAPAPKPAPDAVKPEEVAPKPEKYLIEPGDTLVSISAEVGVSVDELASLNKVQNPNLIYAGSALLIPVH